MPTPPNLAASRGKTQPVTGSAARHYQKGLKQMRRGRPDVAIRHLVQAVELNKQHPGLAIEASNAMKALGRLDDAESMLELALEADPHSCVALTNKGALCIERRRYEEAVAWLTRALEVDAANTAPWINLGIVLRLMAKHADAHMCLVKALELDPENAEAAALLGSTYIMQGMFEEAHTWFTKALRFAPGHAGARAGLAELSERSGDYQAAVDHLEELVESSQSDLGVVTLYARALRRLGRQQEAIRVLEAAIEQHSENDLAEKRHRAQRVLANIHDDVGQFDQAWQLLHDTNQAHVVSYDFDARVELVDATLTAFSKSADSGVRSQNASTKPVFIVGMPRSGTSLTEQILQSHPQAHGLGETPLLAEVCDGMHPAAFNSATTEQLDAMAARFLTKATAQCPDARIVIEKTPHHFLYLGAIERLFPNARIIHCSRNPLDTLLSCYFQDFASAELAYTYDLSTLAGFYRQYERVMEHWREHLQLPVFELHYETLVGEQERVSRELVDFIGLEWDPACLEFHKSRRTVRTSSYAQVRQSLYDRSVARHRNYPEYSQLMQRLLAS